MSGPLAGLRVVEFAGIGPGPHCAMLLADLGAEVVRIDRPGGNGWPNPVVDRGRSAVTIDIRSDEGRAFCYDAADKADVLIEGFRPGVMERLGFGPDILCERNPMLVYGRMTGWGQSGPLAQAAGHDINYIAITGALAAMGTAGEPAMPPLNLVGDFGGGSMFLAFGIMAALWERQSSGRGQVIDAAIVDGVTSLMTMFSGLLPAERISMDRDRNLLAGAAPFYRCYRCADGSEIAVGALEPQFYRELIQLSGAPSDLLDQQNEASGWAGRSDRLADLFATRTAAEWCAMLEGSDACFAPVLELPAAPGHPHLAARETYIEADGLIQAAPAPRFSRTPGRIRAAQPDGRETVARWQAP
ncbi:CaiB/BaiF CoA transferase family protein [Sphingopyxis sp. MSC1_008]|uniref:CaiB/BaiF CoA transferase family protein n=1 Tax=Sphingopyxis sp. MSC1_008 TaxID=2909265 RepID=UPI0020BF688D